jgi:hypothetical protein
MAWQVDRWGVKARPPVFDIGWRLCCVTRAEVRLMAGRMNWSQIASRNRMRRQGVEDIKGKMPLVAEPPKKTPRKLSKAELRQQTAAAFLAWRAGQTSKNK